MNSFLNSSFLRYVTSGIFLNIFGFLTYLLLTFLGFEPKVSMSISYFFFLIIGFFWHKKFSFIKSNIIPSKLRFIFVHASAYLINLLLLFLMVDQLGFRHQYVQGFAIILVAIYLYLMLNHVVFKINRNLNIKNDSF